MARNWRDVRAAAAPLLDEERVAAGKESMRAEIAAYRLAEVRKRHGLSQAEVARGMGVKQPRVSAIEHGDIDRTEYGTLRAYVEAMGGNLKIVADFGDELIVVSGA